MRRKIHAVLLAGALAATALVATATPAAAATLLVGVDGAGCASPDYATIQAAIDVADSGDTIEVCAGTYTEDLSITTSGLTLTSADGSPDATFIEGVATQSQDSFPDATSSTNVDLAANDVTLSNLTFRSPAAAEDMRSSGIVLDGTGITITGNVFEIRQQGTGTPDAIGDTSVAIQTVSGHADATSNIDGLTISGNTFSGTPEEGYYGVYVNEQGVAVGGDVTVANNTFEGRVWRAVSTERDRTTITSNTFKAVNVAATFTSASGVMVHNFAERPIDSVTITDNTFADGDGAFGEGIRLGFPTDDTGADATLTNVVVTGNTIDHAATGVFVHDSASGVLVNDNAILPSSTTLGVDNDDPGQLDATCNWWGAADGPSGSGATVEGVVDFTPFRTTADLTAACPPTGGGGGGTTTPTTSVTEDAAPGDSVGTDTEGDGATAADPVEATVTIPSDGTGGEVSVTTSTSTDETADGFAFLDLQVDITAPTQTADAPLELVFEIDASLLPDGETAATLAIFRDGTLVAECTGASGVADPDPCVSDRTQQGDGDALLTVLTSQASAWTVAEIVDACPAQLIGDAGFTDVGDGNVHGDAIDCVAHWGLTTGFTATSFAPAEDVTRGQMASFLARLVVDAGVALPSDPDATFSDVGAGVHATAIRQLADLGVIEGYTDGTYRPSEAVSRAQTAALAVRSYELAASTVLPTGDDAFSDDDGGVFEVEIDKAAAAGFVEGTTSTTFEPTRDVRRDEMASILSRVLEPLVDLDLASPPLD